MSALNLRLPDSIHRHIKEIAKREGVSINLYRIAPTRTVRMWCPGLRRYSFLNASTGLAPAAFKVRYPTVTKAATITPTPPIKNGTASRSIRCA